MRILYHPQISMRSYEDGRWLLSSDAQLTKMAAWVRELPEDWKWLWLLPLGGEHYDGGGEWVELANARRIQPRPIAWPDNVLQARYDFRVPEMRKAYRAWEPDLILCEVPEHVPAWKVVQKMEGRECPIVAMHEHVDIYKETDRGMVAQMMYRQLEGFLSADLNVFPLEGMREEWNNAARSLCQVNTKQLIDAVTTAVAWPAIFSPREVEGYKIGKRDDVPTVFFAGRLSDEARTHYPQFFAACTFLYERFPFRLWVANPNEAMPWSEVSTCPAYEPSPFGEKSPSREEYLEMLWWADVVPVLYPMSHIYSVGFYEAIMADCVPITAYCPPGSELETAGVVCDPDKPEDIGRALRSAFTLPSDERDAARAIWKHWAMEERSVEAMAPKIESDLLALVARDKVEVA